MGRAKFLIIAIALAIQEANMSLSGFATDDQIDYQCGEYSFKTILSDGSGDSTLLFDFNFNFEAHLYSYATCAGQIDKSYSLGLIFTPIHWNVWVFIILSALFLFAILTLLSGKWELSWSAESIISLILGLLGCEVTIKREFFRQTILVGLIVVWSLTGIMIGNLYQARLTESLIAPSKYELNLTLKELMDKKFKILLIPDAPNRRDYLQSMIDSTYFKVVACFTAQFCRQFVMINLIDDAISDGSIHPCSNNMLSCLPLVLNLNNSRLALLISLTTDYSVLVSELSACEQNTIFIHNRFEMNRVFKPNLPQLSHKYRRQFEYLPISDITMQYPADMCLIDVENLISPILKKYVENGIIIVWEHLASLLMFKWNSGTSEHTTDDLANAITLDGKFLGIIFAGLSFYALSIVVLACEWIFALLKSTYLTKTGILRLFVRIK